MNQQQSQSDRPLSQFELLLQSQQQESQENKRNSKLKKYKKYHQKKKLTQKQNQMEIEEQKEERKRSQPEKETLSVSIKQPKRKQAESNIGEIQKETNSNETNDNSIGIDVNEIIEMFNSDKSNADDELMYLQLPANDESSEEEEEQEMVNVDDNNENNIEEEPDDEHLMEIDEELRNREEIEQIINRMISTQTQHDKQIQPKRRQLTAVEIRKLPLGYISRFNENRIVPHTVGNFTERCSKCGALFFKNERTRAKDGSYNICCSNGKVVLPELPECPDEIVELLDVEFNHQIL